MSYSPPSADAPVPVHFARSGGLPQTATEPPQDPIAAWLDLMEVVEALCPVWPAREVMMNGDTRL